MKGEAIYKALGESPKGGLSLEDLALQLGIGSGGRRELRAALLEMMKEGKVILHNRRYSIQPDSREEELFQGILRLNIRGRGFVDLGEAFDEIVIAAEDQGNALDSDTVEIRAWDGGKRRHGQVVRVLSRGRVRLTGVLQQGRTMTLDDPRVDHKVEVLDPGPARPGQAVLGMITDYPTSRGSTLGVKILRVLGEPGLLVTEVARSVAGIGLDEGFSPEVLEAAEATPHEITAADIESRQDLRQLHFVTIDPLTARDYDDAVAVEQGPGGCSRIWVAVADVSEYVEEGSPMDLEARARGCSLYLPDRAIPMLPPALSSDICSLVPHQDRLAMVVRFDLAPDGAILSEACSAAVIHSQGQLDYSSVAAALEGDFRGRRSEYTQHLEQLERLQQVAAALRQRRMARGSLDLDLPEQQAVLDEDDPCRVRDIVESRPDGPTKQAYNLIEELMLAANEVVARQFVAAKMETLWRVHAPPLHEALLKLSAVMGSYGINVDAQRLSVQKSVGRLLIQLRDHRARRPLSFLVLRALKQAVYGVVNLGHFGLGSQAYLHFTSPIRRYPDLHVHRMLKGLLRQQGLPAGRPLTTTITKKHQLAGLARDASDNERRSIKVERDVRNLYAASLMRDRIGDRLWGTITGITSFGFFVSLDHPFVEGLIKLESIDDWLEFDPDRLRLFGRSGRVFSLGDRVQVEVVDTSVARRQIDLKLLEEEGSHEPDPNAGHAEGGAARPARRGSGRRQRPSKMGRSDPRAQRGKKRGKR